MKWVVNNYHLRHLSFVCVCVCTSISLYEKIRTRLYKCIFALESRFMWQYMYTCIHRGCSITHNTCNICTTKKNYWQGFLYLIFIYIFLNCRRCVYICFSLFVCFEQENIHPICYLKKNTFFFAFFFCVT